jgi:hypothetical protein
VVVARPLFLVNELLAGMLGGWVPVARFLGDCGAG